MPIMTQQTAKKLSNTVRQKCNRKGEDHSEEQKTPPLEAGLWRGGGV